MAYSIISGFAPSTTEPIDSRTVRTNATTRKGMNFFDIYEGLVVYQLDTNQLWVLTDTANYNNDNGWTLVGSGVGGPNSVLSGSASNTYVSASGTNVVTVVGGTTTQTNVSTGITFGVPVTGSTFTGSFVGSLTGTASNADLLDGQHGSFYQNASNINAGTIGNTYLPSAISVTSVTASFSGNLTGTASYATNAGTATSATSAGSVTNAVTFNNGGSGDASGTTFNGSAARTISYNTVGAPKADGTGASGTWGISISGNAATATTATNATNTAITDTTTGTGPYYITFVGTASGNQPQLVDSTGLTYNATTNTITANLTGTASYASTVPYSGLTGVPSSIVTSSVLSSPSQGNAILTTNGTAGSTINLGLTTTSSPSFADLTLSGDIAVNGGDITTSATTFNIAASNATTINVGGASATVNVPGNFIVTGDLTVNGNTTVVNTSQLYVEDTFILLASGSTVGAPQDGGIIIDRGTGATYGNVAYGYDTNTGRWGYQNGLVDTSNAIDLTAMTTAGTPASAFTAYVFTETAHGSTKPNAGEFYDKQGSIYTSAAGDIWIYA